MDLRTVLVVIVHGALLIVGLLLIVIDARTHRLPNRIVLPTLGALIVLSAVDAVASGSYGQLMRGGLGLLILGGFYAALRLINRSGMGGGDVKLAAVIGLLLGWHGWESLLFGAASAFLLGALFALVLMIARKADASTRIAFGPWMVIGAILGVLVA